MGCPGPDAVSDLAECLHCGELMDVSEAEDVTDVVCEECRAKGREEGAPLAPMPDLPTVEVKTPTEEEMVERMQRRLGGLR